MGEGFAVGEEGRERVGPGPPDGKAFRTSSHATRPGAGRYAVRASFVLTTATSTLGFVFGQNGTTEADPNRRRTGSGPLAGREPLSDRSFSGRPGIAGVANLTDRLLREVRYPLDWRS